MIPGVGWSSSPPGVDELNRWAEGLYSSGAAQPPLRGALFTIEQLELHARVLAARHRLGKSRRDDRLLERLAESQRIIIKCHDLMSAAHAAGSRLAPAAEWLLDNHYLIEEQIELARRHYPRGYSRQLPRLEGGTAAGLPRIYDIILQLISHVDGRIDEETLGRYLAAYQSVTHLTLGELWSVAIMLRLALIENLRRVALGISWRRAHRDRALAWAQRISQPGEGHGNVLLLLAELVREDPPLSTAFVAQFTQTLHGRGATTAFVLAWLEQRLAEEGHTIEEVVRAESQGQAADQASMANGIASLRFVNANEWHRFVETHSATEAILRGDPAGVYAAMDFATRDTYRHTLEGLTRRTGRSEEDVARAAVELAAGRGRARAQDVAGHVGYFLIDEGKAQLEKLLRRRRAPPFLPGLKGQGLRLLAYLGPIAMATAALVAWLVVESRGAHGAARTALALCAALAASQCGIAVVNWFVSMLKRPRILPRMDFEAGIPDECRTMVVVPTLLTGRESIAALIEGLELRYLANRDPNLWFALLTDFADADSERMPGDGELLSLAAAGIGELNRKYGQDAHGSFFLFHRPRLYNPQEACWMGRERKRGKLEDFNALLCGEGGERFSRVEGPEADMTSVRYVITLDTDTDLPWGTGWRLVGAAAHPLNRPVMEPDRRRLVRGYAILQPRVGVSLRSAGRSRYSRLLAGEVGLDPYTRAVSDLYQDLFAESSFIGKGIYDVGAFRRLLEGRFSENQVLSHDLLESCYARSAQCSDVELLEDFPSRYLGDVSRRHRWMRGDWQIAPWLGFRIIDAAGRRVYPLLETLGRWKIFDNLRRSLVAPAYAILLALGWVVVPAPVPWTLGILALLFVPELLPGLVELARLPPKTPFPAHAATVGLATARRLVKVAMWVTFLPFEAVVALDAATRALWRMIFSRKRLLEWQTASAAESAAETGLGRVAARMWPGPLLAGLAALALAALRPPGGFAAAGPILILWALSPVAGWWVSLPLRRRATVLAGRDANFLREVARRTWRYFEVFVGPQENWLPPDNFQEVPSHRVAHRTSPTNMGLSLLANLAAHDLGYLSGGQLLDRTTRSFEAMEQLERHRGHFFNWYDTITRKPLRPQYISTVDSGNLVGHVRVLAAGLRELPCAPPLPAGMAEGMGDTLRVLAGQLGGAEGTAPRHDHAALDSFAGLLVGQPRGLAAQSAWLRQLAGESRRIATSIPQALHPEASWWATALDRQVGAFLSDLEALAPWLARGAEAGEDTEGKRLRAEVEGARDLRELALLASRAGEALGALVPPTPARQRLARDFQLCAGRVTARISHIEELGGRCAHLADAQFPFLYDPRRKLMAIGYLVGERRLDRSSYDLLASEARLASYVAIATGQVPFEHWFALGRRLTRASGRPLLLSWSGSMFEYLMPLLVMPSFEGTLLDDTCRAVVAHQIEYGRLLGMPWGVSESGFHLTDFEGNYRYRAFGVPGLGLQRGLGEDLVVSPYSSALALTVDPARSCRNLKNLAREGCLGPYGFYEAIDFTPSRLPKGERGAVVQSFMAHHHGMTLLGLGQAVLGPRMQRRFLGNPDLRAASLLLQERVPRSTPVVAPHAQEVRVARRVRGRGPELPLRVFTNPNTTLPEVHLLSNGRYHVMVSAAGGGYSRWNDTAVTRWREDPTSEALGVFCYVGDAVSRRWWSNSFQPTLRAGRQYEAVFTPGRAEFRRRDDQIETHTEIAVSTEDDVEVRRLRLSNRSESPRSLLVTTYAEVVLAPGVTDELHRAFSGLFVRAEPVPDLEGILMTRRPRSPEEKPPWLFALLRAGEGQVGPCSFETDRGRFLGRGGTARHPALLEQWGPLPGTAGAVLDPCLALRRGVELPVDGAAALDLIIGAAPTREEAMALLARFQDHRMADRVFEVAAAHSRSVKGHLGISEGEARQYEELAAAVIFPSGPHRAPAPILRRNHRNQSGLWAYALSGDLPIVLLRVTDAENLALVRALVGAHAYWRRQGLLTDLVILLEDASGYRRILDEQVMGVIGAGTDGHLIDRPGGIFVRHLEAFTEEDRVLLQAVARVVLRDTDGSLDRQLEGWRRAVHGARPPMLALPPRRQAPPVAVAASPPPPAGEDLLFGNGTGGFTRDGREYRIDPAPGSPPPAPWINVIANPRLGTLVSESGSSCTWYGNAQLYRLSPWSNDAVGDPGGETLFVRDDASGTAFSPTRRPRGDQGGWSCRHGFGYSVFEHRQEELETELTTFVAAEAPVKFLALKVRNLSLRNRSLSVFAAVELVLGDLRSRQAMHVVTEMEPLTHAILARNSYNGEFPGTVAFFDCSEEERSVSGDRAEFLGRNGDPEAPLALRLVRLSGRLGPGLDPCAAMQVALSLAAGEEREVVFILGAAEGTSEAVALLQRHRGVGAARVALEEVTRSWRDRLGALEARTPDPAFDVMVNGWLPYQVLSCRLWGRSAFYQSSGAYGFRDQLQDCLALLHQEPGLVRAHLLLCAERQFGEGDAQHWWHPPGGRGVRTRCSDDYLWLPYAVCRYVSFTGDTAVLDEPVTYLAGRALAEGEESYYDLPGSSGQSGTLYQHCARALLHGLRLGKHGLPLMGGGDWNDGLNRVGVLGRGESVWLGFFLHHALTGFAPLAEGRGDGSFAVRCREAAAELAGNLDRHGWDGRWYRRAWFDGGEPLGSADNDECRIDSLPQSWATLAGVGDPGHRALALDAVMRELVREDLGIVQLFTPPFDRSALEPGYVKGYPPGVRENGGQYTHAAVWAAMALALAGRTEEAGRVAAMLNPVNHALDRQGVERYRVEPYVLAGDVYSRPPHEGRGGWSWYTGSAAWYYRLLTETMLGLDRRGDTLRLQPRVPPSWGGFSVRYRHRGSLYRIEFRRDPERRGPAQVTLDGVALPDGELPLSGDGREHAVEVLFGPGGPGAT